MKCYDCGDTYKEHNGTLGLYNKIIGSYNVYDANYYKCESCGKILYPQETVLKIESVENETRNKLINQLPITEFILASNAAELLEISKQAFNKHRRIKKGFIYSVSLGGKKFYNKKSILLFKKTGDGRFNLSFQQPKEVVKYVYKPVYIVAEHSHYKAPVNDIPEHHLWTPKVAEANHNLLQ